MSTPATKAKTGAPGIWAKRPVALARKGNNGILESRAQYRAATRREIADDGEDRMGKRGLRGTAWRHIASSARFWYE